MSAPVLPIAAGATTALHVIARVGSERFAFPVAEVEEAIDAPQLIQVPGAAAGLAGELRYRDRTVSAFDSGWVLNTPRAGCDGPALVLRDGTRRFAIVVDDVDDLATIDAGVVQAVPPGTDGEGVLSGVWFAAASRLIGLVNIRALLARVGSLGAAAKGELS